ncbi:thiopeptide-type bacteriocin biosynthesis protein [soil metagenome]
MNQNNEDWLSCHLFYTGNWDTFLTHQVKPFVDKVINQKQAGQFFFIRYWERGPHLRLRFKGEKEILENIVKPDLEKFFQDFFEKNPSHREASGENNSQHDDAQLLPNNSIQFISYEPELERYGGKEGVPISEKHFESSSKAVLSILDENRDWDYDKGMGVAIQMHLSFANAIGMNLEDAKHFYSGIFLAWVYLSYDWNNLSKEEHLKKQEIVISAFEDQFEKQKSVLVQYHEAIWEALEGKEEFEEPWLNKWIQDIALTAKEINAAEENNQLVFPHDDMITNTWGDIPAEKRRKWYIYGSYVHMTNNRLGILNRDEAYLGYLIKRSLEAMSEESIKA